MVDGAKLHLESNSTPARDAQRAQTYLVCTRTQKTGAVTLKETEPDLPLSAQDSLVVEWVSGGLLQGWDTECSNACIGPREGGRHYLHYLHHSLASGQTTGREHSPTHQQKTGLKCTDHGPAHQNKTQFPRQSVSPIRKLP